MPVAKTSFARPALVGVCFVWAGMVLGISFLEAPVKFTAPSLTLAVGLDVGRHVFGALNLVEIGWTILTILLVLVMGLRLRRGPLAMLAAVWVIVAAQSFWLLPALDARVVRIIAGETLPSSYHHALFVVLEVAKVALLFGAASLLLWKLHVAEEASAAASAPADVQSEAEPGEKRSHINTAS